MLTFLWLFKLKVSAHYFCLILDNCLLSWHHEMFSFINGKCFISFKTLKHSYSGSIHVKPWLIESFWEFSNIITLMTESCYWVSKKRHISLTIDCDQISWKSWETLLFRTILGRLIWPNFGVPIILFLEK